MSTTTAQKSRTSAAYRAAFAQLGYSFRLNEAGDILECNGKRLDDYTLAAIRHQMRERYKKQSGAAVEDAIRTEANENHYHPIKTYLQLNALNYDGGHHIDFLADHFEDVTKPAPCFRTWLRKWLIGAVAKAMDGNRNQNAMLVLDGAQNIGKSTFARWLCSPLPDYFLDDSINPSDKDAVIRLAMYWIWEVSELGSTMRKADIEALKAFISRQVVTVRKPYGRVDIVKPPLASLIGTVNNSAGILADQTGNRRFLIATINSIDWNYTQNVDPNQIWAEAFAAYQGGETWYLTKEERAISEENNAVYQVPNPMEGYLARYFEIDPNEQNAWTSTADIVARLMDMGYKASGTRALAMEVAATLQEMGLTKIKQNVGNSRVWGYRGIWQAPILP